MTKAKYQQCTRCVMDTSDTDIRFDANGNCNHCTEYLEKTIHRTYRGEENDKTFNTLINRIKKDGKNKPYDCVVGVSGGADSTYTAYLCKKAGLRVLCVHMDNGWNTEISEKNIQNLIEKHGMDYRRYILDWENFRDLQLAFLKASVPEIETPTDIAILGVLHQIASEYGIRYVISGGNFATEGILPKSWQYNAKDTRYIRAIHHKYGKTDKIKIPLFSFFEELYYKFIKKIRIIYILNLVDYNKEKAMQHLTENLDWQYYGGKHHESLYTGFVQSYILPVKFNIDYRKATLSTLICKGEISREQALEDLKLPSFNPEKVAIEKALICEKLEITEDTFDKIMAEPAKSYRNYPNSKKSLECLYSIYRKLKRY